jgi:hypothetical protein
LASKVNGVKDLCAVASLLWVKPVVMIAFFVVGLLVFRKAPTYSLNQLFAFSFFLMGATWLFDTLKDIMWPSYLAVVICRNISVITGVFSTICFLLTGLYVRYGIHKVFTCWVIFIHLFTGIILSAIAISDQIISPTPDPVKLTVIETGLAGSIALFIVPGIISIASAIILFLTSRRLEDQSKRKSVMLLAVGIFVLMVGTSFYAVENFYSVIDPMRIYVTISALIFWFLGVLLSLLAFYPRLRGAS